MFIALLVATVHLFFVDAVRPASAQPSADEFVELKTALKDGNVEQRRVAARQLAVVKPERADPKILFPLLKTALEDSDDKVRELAAAAVARVAWGYSMQVGDPRLAQLRADKVLEAKLITLVADPSDEIRKSVVQSLVLGFDASPVIEKTMLDQFPKEPDAATRGYIVDYLGHHRYTDKEAEKLIIQALGDRAPHVRQRAALYLKEMKPPTLAVQEALLDAYQVEGSAAVRQSMLHAMVANRATVEEWRDNYIAHLERTLAELKEASKELEQAIKTIRTSQ
ncbi:MAG: HEAT repeat domain-containing protein [Phycisphaeraceae bacterium]